MHLNKSDHLRILGREGGREEGKRKVRERKAGVMDKKGKEREHIKVLIENILSDPHLS